MKSTIVVGLQWGDEGKGKIIDAMASGFDYVVRWNGGNNAGHTVVVDGVKFPLSLVPSGVLQRKKLLIAQGAVINPRVLLEEIARLKASGYLVNLTIDPRCHIVMPYHQLMDRANELWKGKHATGSLHLGIGYCYEDRNNRHGIRLEDLVRPVALTEKVKRFLPLKKAIIERAYGMKTNLRAATILKEYIPYGRKLQAYMGDVSTLVSKNVNAKPFLFEQAHGSMLDPVFGTYPYTVAPPTLASAVFTSVGFAAQALPVVGVVKAYTTRVGNGPFPTELLDKTGEAIRAAGGEFGTVSKRPRRCGWLDLPLLRHSVRLNGVTALAVTKLDVLSGISPLKVCIGYKRAGVVHKEFPAEMAHLPKSTPVYRTIAGWKESLRAVQSFRALPKGAQSYLKFIERELGVPIRFVSVGPDRKELIHV